MRRSKKSDLKRRVTLLRYEDSGTSMVWLEGGEDKSPVIAIDMLTSIDIQGIANEVAIEKAKDNEGKKRYLSKRLMTQACAEYAFTVWHEREGVKLDKKALKSILKQFKYDPLPRPMQFGREVTVVGTSDYHGDLLVDEKKLYDKDGIFVHAVRFGTNEKVILKGWTSAKYMKLAGIVNSKELTAKNSGRKFTITKYAMDAGDLFPMSLLRDHLSKRKEVASIYDAAHIKKAKKKAKVKDEFGF